MVGFLVFFYMYYVYLTSVFRLESQVIALSLCMPTPAQLDEHPSLDMVIELRMTFSLVLLCHLLGLCLLS